jgi:hypothetical protein
MHRHEGGIHFSSTGSYCMSVCRHTRRIFVALAVAMAAITTTPPASSQTAPSEETMQAARELFGLLSQDMLAQMTAGITQQVWPMVQRELAGKVDNAGQLQLRAEFERIQRENLIDLMKDAPAIYARYFSPAELRELTAFYRTPLGQKSLRTVPQISADTMQLVMPRMPELQAKTQAAFQRVMQERGYSK